MVIMKKLVSVLSIIIGIIIIGIFPFVSLASPGPTDRGGCHFDGTERHCHALDGTVTVIPPDLYSQVDTIIAEHAAIVDQAIIDLVAMQEPPPPPPSGGNPLADCLAGLTDGWRQCGTPIPLVDKFSVIPELRSSAGPDAVISAWQGAAHVNDELGPALVFHGSGGHSGWGGNETYKLDLLTLQWSLVSDVPKLPDTTTADDVCQPIYPDGSPNSVHSYDYLTYSPDNNTVYRFGGSVYCPFGVVNTTRSAINRNYVWALSLDGTYPKPSTAWRLIFDPLDFPADVTTTEMQQGVSSYDNVSKKIYFFGKKHLYALDTVTETMEVTLLRGDGTGVMTTFDSPDLTGTMRHLMALHIGAHVTVYDISGPIFQVDRCMIPTSTKGNGNGWEYDPVIDRIVMTDGSSTVWFFDWRTCTFTTRTLPAGPVKGTVTGDDRVFSKWMYIPQVDAFVLYNNWTEAPWFLRLDPNDLGTLVQ